MVVKDDLKYQAKLLSDKLRAICEEAINVEIVRVANEYKEQIFVRANYKVNRAAMPRQVSIAVVEIAEGLENKLATKIEEATIAYKTKIKSLTTFTKLTLKSDNEKDR